MIVAVVAAFSSAQADTIYVDDDNCPAAYPVGERPYSLAIGDLDGVNGFDLAVANQTSHDVTVLLNQGDGTFAAAVAYAAGDFPLSVAIGDLDGVNGTDLAVANFQSDYVSVLLNQGDGTFAAAVAYPAGVWPRSVAVGDLDGVNGPDLALAYKGPPYDPLEGVTLLFNQGDGTFAPAAEYDTGYLPRSVAVGDLDGVNGPDLAVAVYGGVSVLLNQGDGTLAPAAEYDAGYSPRSVAVDDLDGAGGLDIVVANGGVWDQGCRCYVGDDVSVLLNQGNGTFTAAAAYGAGDRPSSVAIGDFDGVNGPDLAVANQTSHDVTVLVNQGDGTFAVGSGTEIDPYCSIQTAIDNAGDADEIVVAPGTYFETIDFLGKAVWLHSSDGPEVTIIDAQQAASVVTCSSGEGPETLLEGFTLTGGTGTFIGPCLFEGGIAAGGGMLVMNSDPTVVACVFLGNAAYSDCSYDDGESSSREGPDVWGTGIGGGMYNEDSNPILLCCTFTGNSANFAGGGMYNNVNSNPTVTDCTFSGNEADEGGGMYNANSSPTVTDCTFSGNEADEGGGMYNANSSPTVTDCTFTMNWAFSGGGMSNRNDSSPTVTDCRFSGNIAESYYSWSYGYGGGMYNWDGSNPEVADCKFTDNWAEDGGGGMYNGGDSGSSPTVTDCRFERNTTDFGNGGGIMTEAGNPLITDSLFCENTPDDIWGDWDGDDNTFWMFCRVFGFDKIDVEEDDILNLLDH
jgi:hypothetical protein